MKIKETEECHCFHQPMLKLLKRTFYNRKINMRWLNKNFNIYRFSLKKCRNRFCYYINNYSMINQACSKQIIILNPLKNIELSNQNGIYLMWFKKCLFWVLHIVNIELEEIEIDSKCIYSIQWYSINNIKNWLEVFRN
jgi:hypothetical protein